MKKGSLGCLFSLVGFGVVFKTKAELVLVGFHLRRGTTTEQVERRELWRVAITCFTSVFSAGSHDAQQEAAAGRNGSRCVMPHSWQVCRQ
jgi:hypothetical protein